jgi:alkylated DNA repair dioxygenase AlkB
LLRVIARLPLSEARYRQYTAKRRTVSYGAGYDFAANALTPAPPTPDFLLPLRAKVGEWTGIAADQFTQALVTEYRPGTQLGWHRDVPDFDTVVGISLGGVARIRFRPHPSLPAPAEEKFAIDLQPRSAYVLQRAVRWRWQHAISPTKVPRWSITFRTAAEETRTTR